MFRRRDRRSLWQATRDLLYPRGGWSRAFEYVKHRVRRLPDPPERIARGIFAGVFVTFTPFFGLHLVFAALLAFVMRGNVVASLLATFFGNPLTFVPIAYSSLKTGYWLTGMNADAERVQHGLGEMFYGASRDLWFNFKALFNHKTPEWAGLAEFYNDVFYPYMIGSLIPGIASGLLCYYLSVPVIRAYQKRRNKGVLKARLARLKEKAAEKSAKKAPEKG